MHQCHCTFCVSYLKITMFCHMKLHECLKGMCSLVLKIILIKAQKEKTNKERKPPWLPSLWDLWQPKEGSNPASVQHQQIWQSPGQLSPETSWCPTGKRRIQIWPLLYSGKETRKRLQNVNKLSFIWKKWRSHTLLDNRLIFYTFKPNFMVLLSS